MAPLKLGEAKGEEEYPYHWLGGTSEVTMVDKWELDGTRETTTRSCHLGLWYT
jgi:hypothetical protein